jgi:DNA-binding NarL/FixJ family response regulator
MIHPRFKTRILLVDDEPVIRTGFRHFLANCPNVQVVGEAIDGVDAIQKAEALIPDLIMMDIKMPKMNGIVASKEILKNVFPRPKIIFATTYKEIEYFRECLECEKPGILPKTIIPEELCEAIAQVMEGEGYIHKDFNDFVVEIVLGKRIQVLNNPDNLSQRELETLEGVALGQTCKQIADKLGISFRTVQGHRDNLREKLGLKSTSGLIVYAQNIGLLRDR